MPRASAAEAARTASRVVEEATSLFASRGFAAVSVDDIAREVGATRGAVYHHFTNKAGVFMAVVAVLQANVATAVEDAADAAGEDSGGRLRAGCHAFLESITSSVAARVLLVDAPSVIGWREWRDLDARNSASHLGEALESVGVPEADLGATTALLSGAMNDAALWLAERPGDTRARDAAHRALERVLDAVAPRGVTR